MKLLNDFDNYIFYQVKSRAKMIIYIFANLKKEAKELFCYCTITFINQAPFTNIVARLYFDDNFSVSFNLVCCRVEWKHLQGDTEKWELKGN